MDYVLILSHHRHNSQAMVYRKRSDGRLYALRTYKLQYLGFLELTRLLLELDLLSYLKHVSVR